MEIVTADGKTVNVGDRVYNYYDQEWGIITENPDCDGWFEFVPDAGRIRFLNGERISSYKPKSFE